MEAPQTWNRYAYTLNSPVKYVDPLGLFVWSSSLGGSQSDDALRSAAGTDKKKLKEAETIIGKRNKFRNAALDALVAGTSSDDPNAVAQTYNAYGFEGQDNGVTVTFGKTPNGVTAETGPVGASLTASANGALVASILVTISENASGDDLKIAVAHEGQHVLDRQNFATAANFALAFGYPQSDILKAGFNPTVEQTETRAYRISSYVAQGLGLPNNEVEGHRIWDAGWRAADRATLRDRAIHDLLTSSNNYKKKLANKVF